MFKAIEYLKDKIEDIYMTIVPYEWRPSQLWDKFRCWLFKPYTTIKPRYLPHTWTDKDQILVHMVFEILSLYLEKEKPGEIIDWEWDEEHSKAWKEINELYKWWHETYIPWSETYMDKYEFPDWKFEKVEGSNHFTSRYRSEEEKQRAREVSQQITDEEERMHNEITEKCKRIIELRSFLWT